MLLKMIVHSVLILLCFLTDRTDEESFGIFFVRVGHLVEESSGNDFKFTKLRVKAVADYEATSGAKLRVKAVADYEAYHLLEQCELCPPPQYSSCLNPASSLQQKGL